MKWITKILSLESAISSQFQSNQFFMSAQTLPSVWAFKALELTGFFFIARVLYPQGDGLNAYYNNNYDR